MGFLDRLQAEWPVIEKAPLTFAVAFLLIVAGVWVVMRSLYRHQLDNLNSRLQLKDGEIAEYKRKLCALKPDEKQSIQTNNRGSSIDEPGKVVRIITQIPDGSPGFSISVKGGE